MQTPTTSPTRRAIIGAIVLAAPATAVAAIPASSDAGVSPALAAAIRAYGQSKARLEAFRKVHNPIEEAWFAASKALPHITTQSSYINMEGEVRQATTEPTSLGLARSVLRDFEAGTYYQDPETADFVVTMREAVAAGDAREAELARIRASLGYDAAEARMDELLTADCEALDAALQYPSASFADLLAKAALIQSEEAWDFRDTAEHLIGDIRRLGGVA